MATGCNILFLMVLAFFLWLIQKNTYPVKSDISNFLRQKKHDHYEYKKQDIRNTAPLFDRYIKRAPDLPLLQALEHRADPITEFSISALEALGDKTYQSGKWTIKDILQHMIDMERVFAYRAMRFSRNDQTPLSGFEEDLIAQNTFAGERSVRDLLNEYALLQTCTLAMFSSFNQTMLSRFGIASQNQISVLGLGFLIVGHANHHVNVIGEKYLTLV